MRKGLWRIKQRIAWGFARSHNHPPSRLSVSMCCAECFCMMTAHVKLDDRLSILRAGDRLRKWNSLDDQRVCRVCERKFKGRQIEIRRSPGGRYKMYCPTLGCPSQPNQWFYPQASVVSDVAAPGCWRAGKSPARRQVESRPQAHGHRVQGIHS
jgi:hypothetical protein